MRLRLQERDREDYRLGLKGEDLKGSRPIAKAWPTTRDIVRDTDVGLLITGVRKLQVIHIPLSYDDEPQQIFETLNTTGRQLTESEKVKNWLLMGCNY